MSEYVICLDNSQNPASLIVGKVYKTLTDQKSVELQMIRVIDEDLSEPDGYLYPVKYFAPIDVPEEAKRVLSVVNE